MKNIKYGKGFRNGEYAQFRIEETDKSIYWQGNKLFLSKEDAINADRYKFCCSSQTNPMSLKGFKRKIRTIKQKVGNCRIVGIGKYVGQAYIEFYI